MRPEVYATLSHAGIALVGQVQRDGPAVLALADMARGTAPGCLLHGDLKLANLLEVKRHAVFLDWERASWGDPARDVGALFGDLLLAGIGDFGPFWKAYLAGTPPDPDLSNRVARWAAVHLLHFAYGLTHFEGALGERGNRVLGIARGMLGDPGAWASRWLN